MKTRVSALLLALCLALSLPVFALNASDFSSGRLSGVCADGGALLVTDTFNKVVWRVEGDKVTRFAGVIGVKDATGEPTAVYRDGAANEAYFMEPWAIAPFLDGYAVSDSQANVIRYIANGRVMTLAGTGKAGKTDKNANDSKFDRPTGLATAADGSLYIADTNNGSIRRIDPAGNVTTVVTGLAAPTGICWYDGALYVAETGRSRICRIVNKYVEPFAGVSTEAEDAGEYYGGHVDGPVATARFDHPQGIAAGSDGTIYVSDTGNSAVRAIRDGRVYTLARNEVAARVPASPRGLLVHGDTLRVVDQFAGTILDISLAQQSFADVIPGMWYVPAIEAAVSRGIAGGTGDGIFEPNTPMNRAMFVTMLSRMHRMTDGTVIINGEASFADVPENEWYGASVRWAADNGVVKGEDGSFVPMRSISREELAVMLWRYAGSQGLDASSPADALSAFPDAQDVSPWAADAMRWACAKGVLKGDNNGSLLPRASATRAEALTMLLNFMNAYEL